MAEITEYRGYKISTNAKYYNGGLIGHVSLILKDNNCVGGTVTDLAGIKRRTSVEKAKTKTDNILKNNYA